LTDKKSPFLLHNFIEESVGVKGDIREKKDGPIKRYLDREKDYYIGVSYPHAVVLWGQGGRQYASVYEPASHVAFSRVIFSLAKQLDAIVIVNRDDAGRAIIFHLEEMKIKKLWIETRGGSSATLKNFGAVLSHDFLLLISENLGLLIDSSMTKFGENILYDNELIEELRNLRIRSDGVAYSSRSKGGVNRAIASMLSAWALCERRGGLISQRGFVKGAGAITSRMVVR
jgi:hypothetical protein